MSSVFRIPVFCLMSIHKSQGSEFQVVILPITRQSHRLLQRNLIYTAITRSKSKLVMLGEIAAFDYAIKNEGAKRNTYLVQRFTATDTEPDKTETTKVLSETTEIQNIKPKGNTSASTPHIKEEITEDAVQLSLDFEDDTSEPEQVKDYRLTEENLPFIDPMIGITQEDINQFFKN